MSKCNYTVEGIASLGEGTAPKNNTFRQALQAVTQGQFHQNAPGSTLPHAVQELNNLSRSV